MNILILYHPTDLLHAHALERHLITYNTNRQHTVTSIEIPYEASEHITDQINKANVILLMISQQYLADPTCYQYATLAINNSASMPDLALVAISLSPNNIEETPLKRLKRLPAEAKSISQYKDTNQGYWEVYQGIKAVIEPGYTYKKRPVIAALQALKAAMAVLTIWCIFVLLLPVLFPQDGVKVVKRPFWQPLDSNIYYKIYKIGSKEHKDVVLSFVISTEEAKRYTPQEGCFLEKVNADEWALLHNNMPGAKELETYSAQCANVNFDANDEGEYRFLVQFNKAVLPEDLPLFEGKLKWGNAFCTSPRENNVGLGYFEPYHYLYFKTTKLYAILAIFIFATAFMFTVFNIHKKTSYA